MVVAIPQGGSKLIINCQYYLLHFAGKMITLRALHCNARNVWNEDVRCN